MWNYTGAQKVNPFVFEDNNNVYFKLSISNNVVKLVAKRVQSDLLFALHRTTNTCVIHMSIS